MIDPIDPISVVVLAGFSVVLIVMIVIEGRRRARDVEDVRRRRRATRERVRPDVSWRLEQLATPPGEARPDPHGRVLQHGRGYWQ